MELTSQLLQFYQNCNYENIPSPVIEVQKHVMIDSLSVMNAAVGSVPDCQPFARYAKALSQKGNATILGSEEKATAPLAALANGALSHALDFEDSHDTAFVHSNAVTIPAVLAIAETLPHVTGKEVLAALVLGSEITCRLALGLNEDLLPYGWYMPPVHGSIGAVFAAAKIMKLTADQLLDAISLDMNQYTCSGEVVNSQQSVMRLVRDGFAAHAAVTSCLLAKAGVRARFEHPFEGNKGYYMAYARGNYTPEMVTGNLGKVWESGNVSFKPWPCCRATHTTITGLIELAEESGWDPGNVAEIHVRVSEMLRMVLEEREVKYHPRTVMNAKMSIPFAAALLFTDHDITLDGFRPERLTDPDIQAIAEKVTYEIVPVHSRQNAQAVEITLILKDGTRLQKLSEHALGSLERPMNQEDIYRKYCACIAYSQNDHVKKNKDKLFHSLGRLEQCADFREVMNLL